MTRCHWSQTLPLIAECCNVPAAWRLRVNPFQSNRDLLCNTHLAIRTTVMGSFYFLIMYQKHVPSYKRNNSESMRETLFPFLITITVEIQFIIPQSYLFMMHINLGICYWEDTCRAFILKNSQSAAELIFLKKCIIIFNHAEDSLTSSHYACSSIKDFII